MKPHTRRILGLGFIVLLVGAAVLGRPVEPSHDGKPLAYWLHFINGPTQRQQLEAEAALRGMGARAVPALVRRILAKDPWWKRTLAAWAPNDSRFKRTFHPEEQQGMAAAVALGLLGSDAAVAQPRLLHALRDEDPGVRARAAVALGALESPADSKIPALMAGLNDPDARVRDQVSEALGVVGPAAMPALLAALRQEDPNVQSGALKATGAIFDRNAQRRLSSIPTVRPSGTPEFALDEVFPSTNGVAIRDVLAVLAVRLKSSHPLIQNLSVTLLGAFGSAASPVIPALIEARNNGDKEAQEWVQNALDRIGYTDPNAAPSSSLRIQSQDPTPIGARLFKEAEPLGIGYTVQPTVQPPPPAAELVAPKIPKE